MKLWILEIAAARIPVSSAPFLRGACAATELF
jgi:hypothetical protein